MPAPHPQLTPVGAFDAPDGEARSLIKPSGFPPNNDRDFFPDEAIF
jgi:hypothetical protein